MADAALPSSSPATPKRGDSSWLLNPLRSPRDALVASPMQGEAAGGKAPALTGALEARKLGVFDLTCVGIGGIIGAGVYVLTGKAAALYAGPAVVISYAIAGFACIFAALSYSELASMYPHVSGSAYSYATLALGPFGGFVIGWFLVVEYAFGAATVAVGWSGYLNSLTTSMGAPIPTAILRAPFQPSEANVSVWGATGGVCNLPAVLIVVLVTAIQVRGVKESVLANNVVVGIKILVLLLFICAGASYVKPSYWQPFVPPESNGSFGVAGVLRGSSVVFFSFIGFDSVSTLSAAARHPQRTVPLATLLSLAVCTALYIATALVVTGLAPYRTLSVGDPIAVAVASAGPGLAWLGPIVNVGALLGLTSVVLVLVLGGSRVLCAMAADGNLPRALASQHPRFATPWVATLAIGGFAALLAALAPLDILGEFVSVGTLLAFGGVSVSLIVLRQWRPDLPRPFRAPCYPLVPALGTVTALAQVAILEFYTIDVVRLALLFVWSALGTLWYVAFAPRPLWRGPRHTLGARTEAGVCAPAGGEKEGVGDAAERLRMFSGSGASGRFGGGGGGGVAEWRPGGGR